VFIDLFPVRFLRTYLFALGLIWSARAGLRLGREFSQRTLDDSAITYVTRSVTGAIRRAQTPESVFFLVVPVLLPCHGRCEPRLFLACTAYGRTIGWVLARCGRCSAGFRARGLQSRRAIEPGGHNMPHTRLAELFDADIA